MHTTTLAAAPELPATRGGFSSRRSTILLAAYALLVAVCVSSLIHAGDFSLGRKPWQNLLQTAEELSTPSVFKLWFGSTALEYKADDGRVLRVDNERASEARFLAGLAEAMWTTFKIATLGSLLAAMLGAPLGFLSARNMHAPAAVAWLARRILDVCRSIHTLVFGLLLVGIIGLGPMAGILAIAFHSMGSWGKLYAESIETLDMRPIEAVRATGATPAQVFLFAVWPALLPNFVSNHLYIWEYNMRDSTVLGLIGAGGLGLLLTEAVSLFQWGRLSTLLIAIVLMVVAFDALSRRIRNAVL
ncbi:MAG TPA: phosphonate ABC transporter, permease protein PhnE [Usitatibacteraceae bacterium]|nr:phosphonate ABC transporter, permease protein PhnE [Usitatibacteraceae bacterium]